MPLIAIDDIHLEYTWAGPEPGLAPPLVFLHEGLGSAAMWRDFPAAVVNASGHRALVYSRQGYGQSDPIPLPRPVSFMHDEALGPLRPMLDALGVEKPILVGHSDGGSIALIYAGTWPDRVSALVLEAPHVFVEDICVESIAKIKGVYETSDLKTRLAKYHGANTDGAFWGWNQVWLNPEFRAWNIEEFLSRITCPVLIIQGENDEYGTVRQIEAITRQVPGPVESVLLPDCGHSPHRDQRERTLAAMTDFIARYDTAAGNRNRQNGRKADDVPEASA